MPQDSGHWKTCNIPLQCLRAVGGGTAIGHCQSTWGQCAVEFVHYKATPPGGSVQWTSCNTLPYCLGAMGSGSRAVPSRTTRGGGGWMLCNTLPLCLGVVCSPTLAIHHDTACGDRALQLLRNTAILLIGMGQENSSSGTMPHSLGSVGSGTRSAECRTLWGQWAVDLLQYTHTSPGVRVGCGIHTLQRRIAWGQRTREVVEYTASLPRGRGYWILCKPPLRTTRGQSAMELL